MVGLRNSHSRDYCTEGSDGKLAEHTFEDTDAWNDAVTLLTKLGLASGQALREQRPDRPEIYAAIRRLDPNDRTEVGLEAARLDAELTAMRRANAKGVTSREQRRAAAKAAQLLNDAIRPLSAIASECGAESWREQSDADPARFGGRVAENERAPRRKRFGLFGRRSG